MAKVKKSKFCCTDCGTESPKWLGKCPGCGSWNTMDEMIEASPDRRSMTNWNGGDLQAAKARPIGEITLGKEPRIMTSFEELNRVLGGGLVPGSLVLVGGDPGIGKSTLMLQAGYDLAELKRKVLYVSGEESASQIRMRADRLQAISPNLLVLCETDVERISAVVEQEKPDVLVVDSIQTMYHPAVSSAPGSVTQVRESTSFFLRLAKQGQMATLLVGHVTKEGAIAGPRLLEHMVDCVLYFEGERHHAFRMLRAVKNRFGSTNEVGMFEMRELGLRQVENPSAWLLSDRELEAAGSVVVASMEGSRPLLVELQALVARSQYAAPRRTASGVDANRVALMIAVLEKRLGVGLQHSDAFISVVGGLKLDEPAVDLGVAICLASSFQDRRLAGGDVVFGEVGLTGELRAVSRVEERVLEAQKLGFKRVIAPAQSLVGWTLPNKIICVGVRTLQEALKAAMDGKAS